MKKNHKLKHSGFAFLIPLIILGMIILIIFIGGACVGFVGNRQGTNHTGDMITEPDEDTSGVADEVNANAGGTGACTPREVKKNPMNTNQTSITVKIWKYTGGGAPTSSTKTLVVNRNCASVVTAIFNDIYNDPSKPQISTSDTGCYAHRTNKSWHPYGVACDVNWNENWCAPNCYHKPGYKVGNFWKPGNVSPDKGFAAWVPGYDVRSIPINSPIANAFKKHGWGRGLYSAGFDDVMHFSITGG